MNQKIKNSNDACQLGLYGKVDLNTNKSWK